jgi:asparagine synthetase B (glutamine-hydrolysing)
MCGFFVSTHVNIPKDFKDVQARGWETREFFHGSYIAVQSQLPCYTGRSDFSYYETDEFIFSFTGEIYNTPDMYENDTQYMFACAVCDTYTQLNGQWAFALYSKSTGRVKIGRDPLGQIPLFISTQDGITVSNTLPSIVHTVQAQLDPDTLDRWYTAKHYTSAQTCWQGIRTVPPGTVTEYNTAGDTHRVIRVDRVWHTTEQDLYTVLKNMRSNYDTPLPTASIASGGLDSTMIADIFNTRFNYAINHVGKDWVSNTVHELDIDVCVLNTDKTEWLDNLTALIQDTYTIPYSWSWVGYYIIGAHCPEPVLYTGEGADEIFGGYPDYPNGTTPYSMNPEHNSLRAALYATGTPTKANKLLDQSVFVPVSCTGANLALGCHTVEPRNPYLDVSIANNLMYLPQTGKPELTELYTQRFGKPKPKQGFGGWPDEVFNQTDWRSGCWNLVQQIFSQQ